MNVRRLSSVGLVTHNSTVDYELPKYKRGPYIVDDSGFCPMSEAVKELSRTAPISSDEQKMYYDFPDGKDTGMRVPVQRYGLSDITELSQDILSTAEKVRERLDLHKVQAEQQEALSQALQSNTTKGE